MAKALSDDRPIIQISRRNPHIQRELAHSGYEIPGDRCVVIRQIPLDKFFNQSGLGLLKYLISYFPRQRDITPQRSWRLDDGAYCQFGGGRIALDQSIRGRERCHRVVETGARAVAAPDVKHNRADSSADSHFRTHAVSPEAIDLARFKRPRRIQSEIDADPRRVWHRRDIDAITRNINT